MHLFRKDSWKKGHNNRQVWAGSFWGHHYLGSTSFVAVCSFARSLPSKKNKKKPANMTSP